MNNRILFIVLFIIFKAEAQTSALKTIDSLFARGQYKKTLLLLKKIKPQTFTSLKK